MNEENEKEKKKRSLKSVLGTILLIVYYCVVLLTILLTIPIYLYRSLFEVVMSPSPAINFVTFLILPLILLLLPVFLLVKAKRDVLKTTFISFIAFAIFIGMQFGVMYFSQKYYEDFSSTKWQDYPDYRYLMFEDLSSMHDFKGMDTSSVFELLGTPDQDNSTRLVYRLSIEGFFHEDVLVLETEKGIVISAEIVRIRRGFYEDIEDPFGENDEEDLFKLIGVKK